MWKRKTSLVSSRLPVINNKMVFAWCFKVPHYKMLEPPHNARFLSKWLLWPRFKYPTIDKVMKSMCTKTIRLLNPHLFVWVKFTISILKWPPIPNIKKSISLYRHSLPSISELKFISNDVTAVRSLNIVI